MNCWMLIDSESKSALDGLPRFHEPNIRQNTTRNNTPLPCETNVLEHGSVDERDVNNRECGKKSSHHRPKQKRVVIHSLEYRKRTRPSIIHVEQTSMEMLHLPCRYQKQETQRCKCSCPCTEDRVTNITSTVITTMSQIMKPIPGRGIRNNHECCEAKRAHKSTVNQLVANEINCKNS